MVPHIFMVSLSNNLSLLFGSFSSAFGFKLIIVFFILLVLNLRHLQHKNVNFAHFSHPCLYTENEYEYYPKLHCITWKCKTGYSISHSSSLVLNLSNTFKDIILLLARCYWRWFWGFFLSSPDEVSNTQAVIVMICSKYCICIMQVRSTRKHIILKYHGYLKKSFSSFFFRNPPFLI